MTPEWLNEIRQAEQLFDQKRLDEAGELAARALRRNPNAALAHQVLALIHVERLQFREAIPRLEQALALRPDLVPSHNGLAQCYVHLDDLDRALRALNTALCLEPNHAFAHFNRAFVWLKRGQYREGWVEYEWRFSAGLVKRPELPRPRWDGSSLEHRSIMIHTEQGLGDVLQFVRLLPAVRRKARRLVFACQAPMRAFLSSLPYIDEFFPIDQPVDVNFDVVCPLLSLPALLRLDETDFHASVPYLHPDPLRVQSWGLRLRAFGGFKIGLSWQGNPTFRGDQFRSIPLRYFAPLAQIPGVTFFSVQKGMGLEQVAANQPQLPITVFPDLAEDGTFHDTAALMHHMDLVISSDTAVVHLAGALGRPTWLLLARNSDWRWLIDRPDSPWYPTMRLFRQRTLGDWTLVFENVAAALKSRLAAQGSAARQPVPQLLELPLPPAEFLDRIARTEVEHGRTDDEETKARLLEELERLHRIRVGSLPASPRHDAWIDALKELHARLLDLAAGLRHCQRTGDLGDRFLELARTHSQTEDERTALKREISESADAEPVVPTKVTRKRRSR